MIRALLLMAFVSGCGAPEEYRVEIDPRYTPEEAETIVEAGRAWEAKGVRFAYSVNLPSEEWGTIAFRKAAPPPRTNGWTDWHFDFLGQRRAEVRLLAVDPKVALHEYGHALGLPHSADPADVMHDPPRVDAISAGDMDALNRR